MATHKIELDININISESGKVTKQVKSTTIKPLSEYSFPEIKEIATRGEAEKYFRIGDEFHIKLNDGEILTVAIAGFNMDTDENNNVVPITFTAVNVLEDDCPMTEMKNYLENLFTNRLPEDVRNAIVPIRKGNQVHKLFLHSEKEIFGKTIYSKDNTGEQYPYYKRKSNRCKFKNSKEWSASWWGRSAFYTNSYNFCFVYCSGDANFYYANFSYGVAPAFGI